MSKLRSALLYSFAGKYSTMLVEFVLVMVISRILSPAELGIYSLAAGSIVIGQMLRDFGLSLYLIQEKDLTDEKVQTCFSMSLVLCWSIALIYYSCSGYIADYFGQPDITILIDILALNFVFIPFGTFTLSLLKRDMLFDKIMLIDVMSTLVRGAAILLLLHYQFGLKSMTIGAVLGTITTVVITFRYTLFKYYRISFSNALSILKFTSFVSFSNILTQLRAVVPEMIIGKQLTTGDVAYFGKAHATLGLFANLMTSFVTPVIQPYMSKIKNTEGRTDQAYYRILDYMLAFQWPFCVAIFVFSAEIINVLYGSQWDIAIPLTKVLAVMLFIDGFMVMSDQLLNAVGEVKYIFKYAVIMTVLRIVIVLLAVDYGLQAIVYAFSSLAFVRLALMYPKMKHIFSLRLGPLVAIYLRNLGIAAIVLLASYILKILTPDLSYLLKMVIYAIVFPLSWLLAITLLRHDMRLDLLGLPFMRRWRG